MYIFKQIAQYFGLKTNLLQGLKEKKKEKKKKRIVTSKNLKM